MLRYLFFLSVSVTSRHHVTVQTATLLRVDISRRAARYFVTRTHNIAGTDYCRPTISSVEFTEWTH